MTTKLNWFPSTNSNAGNVFVRRRELLSGNDLLLLDARESLLVARLHMVLHHELLQHQLVREEFALNGKSLI